MSHHNPFISYASGFTCPTLGNTNSLMFDAVGDYLTITDTNQDFHLTGAEFSSVGITFNCWVKFDDFTQSEPLLCVGRNENNYYGYAFMINGQGKPQIQKYGANGSQFGSGSNNRETLLSTTVLSTGQWYMLTFVMESEDHADWTIYVDGQATGVTNSGNDLVILTYKNIGFMYFGRQGRNSSEKYMAGNCVKAAAWLAQLDSSTIENIYNAGSVGDPSQECTYGAASNNGTDYSGELQFQLDFTEGTGSSLTDETGNGHNATIVGATWETDTP